MAKKKKLYDFNVFVGLIGLWGVYFTVMSQLNMDGWYSSIQTIIVPILIFFVLTQRNLNAQKSLYELIDIPTGINTSCSEIIDLTKSAKKHVKLCHFRDQTPSDSCKAAIKEARERDVSVTRIVGSPEPNMENHEYTKWIEEETNQSGTCHYFLKSDSIRLSFEIYIFDDEIAAMSLPDATTGYIRKMNRVLISSDPKFVNAMNGIYSNLINQSE